MAVDIFLCVSSAMAGCVTSEFQKRLSAQFNKIIMIILREPQCLTINNVGNENFHPLPMTTDSMEGVVL